MPQLSKKAGPSKKSEYYLKEKSTDKQPNLQNESLRYKALENKVFYFDFKNRSTATWLDKEIRKLGGRVEYFFGKDVQYLITDKPQTARDSFPPCSPFSNPGPSPFSRPDTSQSMRDGAPPTHSEWAYSDQWKKPQASSQRSRASKLMELASITKSQGSCDVLSRAKERGTTIKTVEQITSWLNTVHKKLGTKMSRGDLKQSPKNPTRKLRGSYLKVEDIGTKYKPQVLDDAPAWQTIDCMAITDQSPFNTEKRRLTRKQANQGRPVTIKSILKKETPTTTTTKKKKKSGLIRKRGGGKCEGCNVRFDNLETHLDVDQHLKYSRKDKNFEAIDQLISEGLSLDTFLLEQQKRSNIDSKQSQIKNVSSPQVKSDGSTTEPLDVDGPCTRSRKQKYHIDLATQPSLPPKEVEQAVAGPSPKVSGVPELENNYFLRSTPRKLVGLLDYWQAPCDETALQPDQISQVSDGTVLQCHSLDLYSSQEQITVQEGAADQASEFLVKRPRTAPPATPRSQPLTESPGPCTRLRSPANRPRSPPNTRSRSISPASRSRNNSTKCGNSPLQTISSPAKSRILDSPSKRSPRHKDFSAKRRVINHS